MSEEIDELTIQWVEDDGTVTLKELDKQVLSRGSWATVMVLYQDRNRQTGEFAPPRVRIVRYQKRGGRYLAQSKFNISSANQARQIVAALERWFPGEAGEDEAGGAEE